MPRFPTLIVWLLAVFVVSGCDTVKGWTGSGDGAKEEAVSVGPRSASGTAATRLGSGSPAMPPSSFPPPSDADLNRLASQSDPSVEVYDAAGGARVSSAASGGFAPPSVQQSPLDTGGGVPSVSRDYQGVPLTTDPSVIIYPLDGDMTAGAAGIYAGRSGFGAAPPLPPRPVGHAASAPAARTGGGVSSLYFPYGSAQISGKDRATLDGIAESAKFAPVDRVRIEGHASPDTQTSDPVEARILNLRESLKRAGSVSEKLIQKGVPAEKIETVGWGDTVPAGGNEQQRRVDIVTGGN